MPSRSQLVLPLAKSLSTRNDRGVEPYAYPLKYSPPRHGSSYTPVQLGFGHFLTGRETEWRVSSIGVARTCANARHTDDAHAFQGCLAASVHHLLVTGKIMYLPPKYPPFESARGFREKAETERERERSRWPSFKAIGASNRKCCGGCDLLFESRIAHRWRFEVPGVATLLRFARSCDFDLRSGQLLYSHLSAGH